MNALSLKTRTWLAALAALVLPLAALAVHESTCEEDTCVVWVCAWHGDGECGPGARAVDVRVPPALR